jgi:4'-phosphopantetheinyl transferase
MIWCEPPSTLPPLKSHVVHIWRANLDHYSKPSVLSPDETARAERFKFDVHRNRFIAARTILRRLLSQYLNHAPDSLQFEYTSYGKPYLPHSSIFFNLSHANEWALYAISLEEKTGVDIEHVKPDRDMENIAARFFSNTENQWLKKIPEDKKQEAFFRIWTCKEAFIKAIGEGLSFPLKDFDVAIVDHSARIVSINQNEKEAALWSCVALDPVENYTAALAIRSPVEQLVLWETA